MATTPVPTPQPYSALHPISVYLKAHEHLLIVLVLVLAGWFSVGKVENIIAAHDNANLQQAKAVAQVQQEKNAALSAQVASQAAQYQALADKVQVQNAALVAANTQLATALAKQQKTDASLPLPDLANRWTVLVPSAKPIATPSGLAVDTPGAIATVQSLEQVPVLSAQIENDRTQIENTQNLLTASNGQVTTLNEEVSGLRLEAIDQTNVCDARVKVETDKVHTARRRWFKIGFVIGFLSRQIIKTETGW